MTSHELARKLLELPDLPVTVNTGEPPELGTVVDIEPCSGEDGCYFDCATDTWKHEPHIRLT